MNKNFLVGLVVILCGCHSVNHINSVEEYCDMAAGNYSAPFWADIVSTTFDEDAIRADYGKFLNEMYLEVVADKSQPMAWIEDKAFHLINVSSTTWAEPEIEINRWKNGVELAQRYKSKDLLDDCLYGTSATFFDSIHIHSMQSDSFGSNWTDHVTIITTDREPLSSLESYKERIEFLDNRKLQ